MVEWIIAPVSKTGGIMNNGVREFESHRFRKFDLIGWEFWSILSCMKGWGSILSCMKASCTWGEGPDILLSLESDDILVLEDNPKNLDKWVYGTVNRGSIDLRLDEAKELVCSLTQAINRVEELERLAKELEK